MKYLWMLSIMLLMSSCVFPIQKIDTTTAVPVSQPATRPPENTVDAIRKAAENGDAIAQKALATRYLKGDDVPQDYTEAATWMRKSAEQGNADAQNNLGILYAQGKGVPQDHVFAYMWMSLSAAQANQEAAQNRDNVSRIMPPARIAEAKELVKNWKTAARP
ncbi:MAG: sel1 repeat family protein [Magnetococcales bacterium]|nr:sel1 repeat family protein [Magnetococcales bacterium]